MIFTKKVLLLLLASVVLVGLTIWSVTTKPDVYAFELLYGSNICYAKNLKEHSFQPEQWHDNFYIGCHHGYFELEGVIDLPHNVDLNQWGVLIAIQASYRVYWDGVLVGKNGRVGSNKKSEVPGKINNQFILPERLLSPGRHKVKLELSNFHRSRFNTFRLIIAAPYQQLIQRPLLFTAGMYVLAGCFITIAIYYLILFIVAYRQASVLIFSALSLMFCFLTLFKHSRPVFMYDYPWHQTRLIILETLGYLICYLIVLFFLFRFRFPKKIITLIVFSVVLYWIDIQDFYPEDVYFLYIATLFTSLLVIIWAMAQGQKGSLESFIGLLPCFLSLNYYDFTLYLGFFGLVLIMLISLGVQFKTHKKAEQEALLRSGRLEIELLKKQLHPHFLMNTLTSIIGWIEAEPPTSVKLIEALAKELDILLEISAQKLITIQQEIDLCQSHIGVMQYRKAGQYVLEVNLEADNALIPPAVFHTLLENGISHHLPEAGNVTFLLTQTVDKAKEVYMFESRYTKSIGTKREASDKEGTGHRYIKARLEESFSQGWSFTSQSTPKGWRDVIEIKR
ncbi:hypothetical protein BKI52_14325 [marine bacterium AO1-C]|nr:hypothetical protein BKI52_14325 [marine bacterium AO1-C]